MNAEHLPTLAILGLGLIGGSLALGWRAGGGTVVGYDADPAVRAAALSRGVVDAVAETAGAAATGVAGVAGVAGVVLSAPVGANVALLEEIAPVLRPGIWVSDVGGTKRTMVARAAALGVPFFGGHPMAGAERGGLDGADPLLFQNAAWVLCAADAAEIPPDLLRLVGCVGARPVLLSAERHDRVVAHVSHLPQLVAVALMTAVARLNEDDPAFLTLAAGGFRDLTRVASSPFAPWADILRTNGDLVAEALVGLERLLAEFRHGLDGNPATLAESFTRARTLRDAIPRNAKGFLHPLAELFVFVEDRPGTLADLSGRLAAAAVNLADIELLKVREGTGGAFRLGFAERATAERAATVLQQAGYRVQRASE